MIENPQTINDVFTNTFNDVTANSQLEMLKANGSPLFDEKDPIMHTKGELANFDKLLISIINEHHVTEEYFKEMFQRYSLKYEGNDDKPGKSGTITTSRSNLVNALKAGHITSKTFFKTMKVLGLRVSKITIEIDPKNGNIKQPPEEFSVINQEISSMDFSNPSVPVQQPYNYQNDNCDNDSIFAKVNRA